MLKNGKSVFQSPQKAQSHKNVMKIHPQFLE